MCEHKKYSEGCYDCRFRFLRVKSYSHSREVEFEVKARNGLYFGVEIEIECGIYTPGEVLEAIKLHVTDCWEFKSDGSLNDGIEFESQPLSLAQWTQDKDKLEWIKHLPKECKSHDTTSCGLHIHVSRDGLTDTKVEKINFFTNLFAKELQKLGRRQTNNYCHFKSPEFESREYGKYKALNLSLGDTIEFRFPKGTLYGPTIRATVQLIAAICELAPTFSRQELLDAENDHVISDGIWGTFISRIVEGDTEVSKHTWWARLVPYLKKKGMVDKKLKFNDV